MGQVEIGRGENNSPVIVEFDDEFSFKNFANQSLKDKDLNGKTIYSSLFYWEEPDSSPFPENMTGVTFVKCNLDNVVIPEGNAAVECSNRRFQKQEDGFDWVIDENGNPVERL
jgi:hypothetical protein